MDLEEMIEKVNNSVDKTLSITCYKENWEIHSYAKDSLFAYHIGGEMQDSSLVKLMEKAYKRVKRGGRKK